MKKTAIVLAILISLSGAASAADKEKTFEIMVDPPDSAITVVSGADLSEQQYRSPASITATVPQDPALAKKAVVRITCERYKPAVIALRTIRSGDKMKVRLERDVRKHLKFRMVDPRRSDEIQIKDERLSIGLAIDERQMEMNLRNNSSRVIRVLWERAVYTDVQNRTHRLMHPGIRYEERNHSLPYQMVMPYVTLRQPLFPVDEVTVNRGQNSFETKPLFAAGSVDSLKGKVFDVLIPIEIDSSIVPYRFKIKVVGMVQE